MCNMHHNCKQCMTHYYNIVMVFFYVDVNPLINDRYMPCTYDVLLLNTLLSFCLFPLKYNAYFTETYFL